MSANAKRSWPELVGLSGESAKPRILSDRPDIQKVQIIPYGSMVTADYRLDRVRIYVDQQGKVTQPPNIG
jgi:hypothetical protein